MPITMSLRMRQRVSKLNIPFTTNLNLIAHLVMDFFNQRKSANKISMDGRTFKEKLEWFYEKSTERLELNAKEKFEEENSQ